MSHTSAPPPPPPPKSFFIAATPQYKGKPSAFSSHSKGKGKAPAYSPDPSASPSSTSGAPDSTGIAYSPSSSSSTSGGGTPYTNEHSDILAQVNKYHKDLLHYQTDMSIQGTPMSDAEFNKTYNDIVEFGEQGWADANSHHGTSHPYPITKHVPLPPSSPPRAPSGMAAPSTPMSGGGAGGHSSSASSSSPGFSPIAHIPLRPPHILPPPGPPPSGTPVALTPAPGPGASPGASPGVSPGAGPSTPPPTSADPPDPAGPTLAGPYEGTEKAAEPDTNRTDPITPATGATQTPATANSLMQEANSMIEEIKHVKDPSTVFGSAEERANMGKGELSGYEFGGPYDYPTMPSGRRDMSLTALGGGWRSKDGKHSSSLWKSTMTSKGVPAMRDKYYKWSTKNGGNWKKISGKDSMRIFSKMDARKQGGRFMDRPNPNQALTHFMKKELKRKDQDTRLAKIGNEIQNKRRKFNSGV